MRILISMIVILLALSFSASSAHADTLLIQRVENKNAIELPKRGMLMTQVEARFGVAESKSAPVAGNKPQHPAITRWIYPQFTVYFENNHVVSSVLKKSSTLEIGPKPAE